MIDYKKILVAVDLSDEYPLVLDKALAIAELSGAVVHMVHVMEPIAMGYVIDVASLDIDGMYAEAAKYSRDAMLEMAGNVDIPAQRVHNVLGYAATEIRELARQLAADLVVMGGHGKHGLNLLLGSTSAGVTHGISCDLLIVRMPG